MIPDEAVEAAALRILEACDPGDCGCGQPHSIPAGHEDLIAEMVQLLEESEPDAD